MQPNQDAASKASAMVLNHFSKESLRQMEQNEKTFENHLKEADDDFKSGKVRRQERREREKEQRAKEEGEEQEDVYEDQVGGERCILLLLLMILLFDDIFI